MNKSKCILKIKNFYCLYNKGNILKNINLDIYQNNITSFIGRSGSGKTTLLRSINRLNDMVSGFQYKGSILFNDINIYDKKYDLVNLRKNIGIVFQKSNVFNKSIYDNIVYGSKIHGIHNKNELDKIVKQTLSDVYLWDEVKNKLDQSANSLSGGQKQRLCIARSIATKPNILLMDEPTSALDAISSSKIESLIMTLKKSYTIILVTHNLQQATRVSDYIGFFNKGSLIEYNTAEKIVSNPKNKLTEEYLTRRF